MLEEKSYGIILVRRVDGEEDRYLILKQNNKPQNWSYPKGHPEGEENKKESALRELYEETGITDIEFANLPSLFENYQHEKDGKIYNKTNEFFIVFTDSDKVTIQAEEVLEYKWATYDEAMQTFTYEEPKKLLKNAREYLDPNGLNHEIINANYSDLEISEAEKLPRIYKARAVLLKPDNKVVLVHIPSENQIGTPGGKIEEGETLYENLIRECKEETGYTISIVAPLGYGKLYRQKYVSMAFLFLARTVGEPEELSLMDDEIEDGQSVIEMKFDEALEFNKDKPFTKTYLEEAKKYLENKSN